MGVSPGAGRGTAWAATDRGCFLGPFTDVQTEAQGGGLPKDEVTIRSLEL